MNRETRSYEARLARTASWRRGGIRRWGTALATVLLAVSWTAAASFSIPKDQLDRSKVYFGSASSFDKAGEVDYEAVIRATPEYEKIKKGKVQRGTGKYWILLSQASDRAVDAIGRVGKNTEYDLIAASGYLEGLDPAVPADDITDAVLKALDEDAQK